MRERLKRSDTRQNEDLEMREKEKLGNEEAERSEKRQT